MSHVKAELLGEPVHLETDMTHLVQKNDSMLPYRNHKIFSSYYVRMSLEVLLPIFLSSNIVRICSTHSAQWLLFCLKQNCVSR